MTIDPEIIPAKSKPERLNGLIAPKWIAYFALACGVFIIIGIIKNLLPVVAFALIAIFIWKQSKTN